MAGDWIKLMTSLPTSGKVVRVASALDADKNRALGGLVSALCLADVHADERDGEGWLDGYTPEALDAAIGLPGLTKAMIEIDWVRVTPQAVVFKRFGVHNGNSAKRRASESRRKRGVRNVSAPDADTKRPREEKRREEIQNPPNPPSERGEPSGFNLFWSAFPRKFGMENARRAWHTATVRNHADPAEIIAAAREYAQSPLGRSKPAAPSSWLRGGCWADDRALWQTGSETAAERRRRLDS